MSNYTYDFLPIGMEYVNITQRGAKDTGGSSLSHPGHEWDLAGKDIFRDPWIVKTPRTYWYCAGRYGTSGTFFFWSVDKNGKAKKILCADGYLRYITLALTHSEADWHVGKTYKLGDVMYIEGTKGVNFGAHIHVSVCNGHIKDKVGSGLYIYDPGVKKEIAVCRDEISPEKFFVLLKGWNKIVNLNGAKLKTVESAKGSGWVRNSKGWWYLNSDGSYPASKWVKLDAWYA